MTGFALDHPELDQDVSRRRAHRPRPPTARPSVLPPLRAGWPLFQRRRSLAARCRSTLGDRRSARIRTLWRFGPWAHVAGRRGRWGSWCVPVAPVCRSISQSHASTTPVKNALATRLTQAAALRTPGKQRLRSRRSGRYLERRSKARMLTTGTRTKRAGDQLERRMQEDLPNDPGAVQLVAVDRTADQDRRPGPFRPPRPA